MADNKSTRKRITVSQKTTSTPKSSTPTGTKGQKASAKKSPAKKVKNSKGEFIQPSKTVLHRILPFVWFVLALFLFACLVLSAASDQELMGFAGKVIYMLLFGLLGHGAWLVPVFFLYYCFKWRRFVDGKRSSMIIKTVLYWFAVLFVSALCQVFVSDSETYPGVGRLWDDGIELIGGGVIGGSLGWLCYIGLSVIGSVIIICALLAVMIMFMFDKTPYDVALSIRAKAKMNRERRLMKAEERRYAEQQRAELYAEEYGSEPEDEPRHGHTRRAAEESRALDEKGKKFGKIKITKRGDEPEEVFDDGFFDIKPEKDAVIVDHGEEEAKEPEKAEESAPEKESEEEKLGSFTLGSIFDEHRAHGMQANDDDDNVCSLYPVATSEPEEESEESAEPEKQPWIAPPIDLLVEDKGSRADLSESIAMTKRKLYETLQSFDIGIKDIGCSIGPTITRYEVVPEAGVRVRAIANLVDDIAMNLATAGVRIEAPIPNKPAVGIEVPNDVQATVHLRTLIDTDTFRNSSPLTVCLGQDVAGKNVYFDIKKMPHMIIAGTTGSGKSVCINGIVCSLLYKNSPDAVKIIMIDPKKVEFSIYQHIPHLYCPIISDPRKAAGALASAVAEMERRYTLVEDVGVRDIDSYNAATARDPDREYLPKLIIVIDELADLMMMAKSDVEQFITRIAQKARAVGIHLIIGTQRPSVDVITGLIKANVPSRIACTVKSQVDSRTILDVAGAEKLIGHGDMLFSPVGLAKPMRVQGAFLADDEVSRVVDFIKANNAPVEYNSAFMDSMEAAAANVGEKKTGGAALDAADMSEEHGDAKFRQAVEIAINEGKISTSLLQRKLEIGYGRAAKIIDRMEELGYVSEPDGNKPRRILITKQEFYEKVMNDEVTASGDGE